MVSQHRRGPAEPTLYPLVVDCCPRRPALRGAHAGLRALAGAVSGGSLAGASLLQAASPLLSLIKDPLLSLKDP